MELVFRSETGPCGPWESAPNNPLISATTQDDIQNTGHADLVEDPTGEWKAVCLAVRPYRQKRTGQDEDKFIPSPFGRETFLMDVSWEKNWPIFNRGMKLQFMFEAEAEPAQLVSEWRDGFQKSEHLGLGWYHKNTPLKREYSLQERENHLRLWGGPYNLQSLESPTLVLRKQTLARGTWETRLDFQAQYQHCEAGTVIYWNPYSFSSIGIRKGVNGKKRIIRLTIPTSPGEFTTTDLPLDHMGPVKLAIKCSEVGYTLGYAELDDEYKFNHLKTAGIVTKMDNLEEKQREMIEAALILLSMAHAVWDPAQTPGDVNASSAPETSVDDDMLEAAASLLLLSTHPVVNAANQAASDSQSTQSVEHDDTPGQDSSASATPDLAPIAPDALLDADSDAGSITSDTSATANAVTSGPIGNPQWAGLTADQQAIQQRRLDMTAWQRYQQNLQAYDHVNAQGSVIGRLWQTTTERHTFRQNQRRRGATLLRAATTRGRSFSNRHSNDQN
ncbi:glycosyl hydrolase, partial [Aureobasidium melanogenum]